METAGRAVVFSGTTVAIGLLALVALPLPFLRSVGYGGMLIPLVSVIVALTLLPVVLSTIGPKLDWPHMRTDDRASQVMDDVGASWWCAGAGSPRSCAAVVLALLVFAATNSSPASSNVNTIATEGNAKTGLVGTRAVRHRLGRAAADRGDRGRRHLASGGGGCDGGRPGHPRRRRAVGSAMAARRRRPRRRVPGSRRLDLDAGRETLDTDPHRRALGRPRASAWAGFRAQNEDFINAVYGNFPLMILLIAVITFILLARAFRSLLLPLKAVILNVISVAAAWGVIVLVWQEGLRLEA